MAHAGCALLRSPPTPPQSAACRLSWSAMPLRNTVCAPRRPGESSAGPHVDAGRYRHPSRWRWSNSPHRPHRTPRRRRPPSRRRHPDRQLRRRHTPRRRRRHPHHPPAARHPAASLRQHPGGNQPRRRDGAAVHHPGRLRIRRRLADHDGAQLHPGHQPPAPARPAHPQRADSTPATRQPAVAAGTLDLRKPARRDPDRRHRGQPERRRRQARPGLPSRHDPHGSIPRRP